MFPVKSAFPADRDRGSSSFHVEHVARAERLLPPMFHVKRSGGALRRAVVWSVCRPDGESGRDSSWRPGTARNRCRRSARSRRGRGRPVRRWAIGLDPPAVRSPPGGPPPPTAGRRIRPPPLAVRTSERRRGRARTAAQDRAPRSRPVAGRRPHDPRGRAASIAAARNEARRWLASSKRHVRGRPVQGERQTRHARAAPEVDRRSR